VDCILVRPKPLICPIILLIDLLVDIGIGGWCLEVDQMTDPIKLDVYQETLQLSSWKETAIEIGHNDNPSKLINPHHQIQD
jgi:hypothetical protein